MKKPVRNLPASVRDRLAHLSSRRRSPFNEVLQYYAIERLLFRLAQSEHCDKFVLKGGLVFVAWRIPLRRTTRDIDLQGETENTIDNLVAIFRAVCQQPVELDGMRFDAGSVTGWRIMDTADLQGVAAQGTVLQQT